MHSSPIYYIAVIFIAVLLTNSEAKRKYEHNMNESYSTVNKKIGQLNWKIFIRGPDMVHQIDNSIFGTVIALDILHTVDSTASSYLFFF